MSQGFCQSLNLKDSIFAPGSLLVAYQNSNVDASFVLHYLASDFVKRFGNDSRILLVLSNESVQHWTAVSTKLGWNVNAQQAKGSLSVIDLGQEIFQILMKSEASTNCITSGHEISLENLYLNCEDQVVRMCTKRNADSSIQDTGSSKVLIVVEDATSLLFQSSSQASSACRESQVLTFLKNLLKLNGILDQKKLKCDVSVATLVNSSGSYFSSTIAKILANTVFEVSPLQTGYSHLFSGYVLVKRRAVSVEDKEILAKTYQFKLDDRQIKFSPLTKFTF